MKNLQQKGFTIIEALLIILVLSVIGFGGYYVWNTQHKKTATTTTPTYASSSTSTTPATTSTTKTGDLVVKEWGVKVTVPKALTGVTYEISGSTVTFNSDQQKAITACGTELKPQTAWGITREASGSVKAADGTMMTDSEASANSMYMHIGSYFYHRVYPQTGCTSEAAKITPIETAYTTLFSSLAAN